MDGPKERIPRKPLTAKQARELLTFSGFVVMTLGIAGGWGLWSACQVSGGLVFGLGLYGMSRR